MNTGLQEHKLQLSDEEIISAVLAGDKRMYELIIRRYNASFYRIGMSIVNNDAEVEDIMQVAYIKAYEHLHLFLGKSRFSTWITRILINESLNHLKKRKRHMDIEATDNAPADDKTGSNPAGKLLNKELSRLLEQALAQLPEKYRLVFMLREVEDMSIADTMDALNLTEANVKVRLNRAKTMLKDSLGSYYRNGGIYHFHLSRCNRIADVVMNYLGIPAGQ